jgi:ribosome-associated translation inhibitor RaiA
VVDKLSQQLRKRKTKLASHKKHVTRLASEGRKRGYTHR